MPLALFGAHALLCAQVCAPVQLYTYTGEDTKDYTGYSVDGAGGDLDGDGVPDFLVGSVGDDAINNSVTYTGTMRVYSGASGALLYQMWGDLPGDRLGRTVAGLSDLNGDGVPEIAAGAANKDVNGIESGMVRIYDGATGTVLRDHYGDSTYDKVGWAINDAGDVDGDGVRDVVAGARMYSDGTTPWGPGYARVYSGATGAVLHTIMGENTYDQHGFSVDGTGDLDGDGRSDLIVGAPYNDDTGVDAGKVRVYSGLDGSVLYTYWGLAGGDRFGYAVAGGQDVDGDGVPDFIVGAPNGVTAVGVAGYAQVYSGADGALLHRFEGLTPDGLLGHAVELAGDLDGDGRPDPLVGGGSSKSGTGTGRITGYSGVDGSILWTISSAQSDALGADVAVIGDLDRDGLDDVIGGAWLFSTARTFRAGRARVYLSRVKEPGLWCDVDVTMP